MILTGGNVNSFTVTAATTTTNTNAMAENVQQSREPQQQSQTPSETGAAADFWWWPAAPTVEGGASQTGHQHQQISSSSSQQQQQQQQLQQQTRQMDCSGSGTDGENDEFDAFDLSLLINGSGDGYFGDAAADCRVPSAAFSATVMVHTNAALNANGEYYASTTAAQQQLDMQQLMSLCDDYCFFNENTAEVDVKPTPVFHQPTTAAPLVSTTTANPGSGERTADGTDANRVAAVVPRVINAAEATTTVSAVANTTLLRSLLAADPLSPPAVSIPSLSTGSVDSNAPAVESTTEAVAAASAITTTMARAKSAAPVTTDRGDAAKSNKHRLLIEMLRGGTANDDVVVPVARPSRRRPRTAAFGADDGEPPCGGGGRRRLDDPSIAGQRKCSLQQDTDVGDELLLYGNPFYSETASASWLDRMVAAAAAATTGVANSGSFYDSADQLLQKDDAAKRRDCCAGDDIDSIVDECCGPSDFCGDYGLGGTFDQGAVDGGYFSAAAAEIVYSPPTAAQVPSVTPPPPPTASNDPSETASTVNK